MKTKTASSAYEWYGKLKKPSWAPPKWLFGPVWTVLYILIAVSFGTVFIGAYQGLLPVYLIIPFIANLLFNFCFTPIQFGLQSNGLAAVDICLVWVTLAWSMIAVYPFVSWVTYAQIPYMLWVSFAMVLQLTVTYLNLKTNRTR